MQKEELFQQNFGKLLSFHNGELDNKYDEEVLVSMEEPNIPSSFEIFHEINDATSDEEHKVFIKLDGEDVSNK